MPSRFSKGRFALPSRTVANNQHKLFFLSRSRKGTKDVHDDELEVAGSGEKLHVAVSRILNHLLIEAFSTSVNVSLDVSRQVRSIVMKPHHRIHTLSPRMADHQGVMSEG